jgi:hypothetical protein
MSGTYQPLEGEEGENGVVPVVNSEADGVTTDNQLSCDTLNSSSNQPESISQNDTNLHDGNETQLSMLCIFYF